MDSHDTRKIIPNNILYYYKYSSRTNVFFGGFRQISADFGHWVYFGLSSNPKSWVMAFVLDQQNRALKLLPLHYATSRPLGVVGWCEGAG